MARLPRLYAPAVVQHVIQRAATDRRFFVDADDYALFLDLMRDAARTEGLAVHAYVLLPGEIQVLGTPSSADSIPRTLQAIGRRYVPHANRKAGRDGPLWDRRYRSTLVDAAEFLFPAMRFVEGRPVEADLVADVDDWPWSSRGHHVGRVQQPLVTDHLGYWALSDTPFERQAAYRTLSGHALDDATRRRISDAVERGWVLGGPGFTASIEGALNRRAHPLPRGRPRKVRLVEP